MNNFMFEAKIMQEKDVQMTSILRSTFFFSNKKFFQSIHSPDKETKNNLAALVLQYLFTDSH